MGDQKINIICFADDAVLISEKVNDLQKLLHQFNSTAKTLNMNILTNQTKCMTISRDSVKDKLKIEGKVSTIYEIHVSWFKKF